MPPTYRERLRLEGAVLAGAGAAGSVALLAVTDEASRWPLNTVGQLAVVAGLLGWIVPRSARRAMGAARSVDPGERISGDPTPVWQHPIIVASLTASVVLPREFGVSRAGWDAGLRVTAGCMLVGLAQAVLAERVVAAGEARTGRRYVRVPGSRLIGGTKLGFFGDSSA
ncbi:MAG: hypothetical protein H0T43_05730 [Solirubrobacterales bacterium]|nr:hypothetical protein [Solirubrobacterales bacterium]